MVRESNPKVWDVCRSTFFHALKKRKTDFQQSNKRHTPRSKSQANEPKSKLSKQPPISTDLISRAHNIEGAQTPGHGGQIVHSHEVLGEWKNLIRPWDPWGVGVYPWHQIPLHCMTWDLLYITMHWIPFHSWRLCLTLHEHDVTMHYIEMHYIHYMKSHYIALVAGHYLH